LHLRWHQMFQSNLYMKPSSVSLGSISKRYLTFGCTIKIKEACVLCTFVKLKGHLTRLLPFGGFVVASIPTRCVPIVFQLDISQPIRPQRQQSCEIAHISTYYPYYSILYE
jgi:hypothetical protein